MTLNWTFDMIPSLEWYADRCCAAGIDSSFMHYFYVEDGYANWINPLLDTIAKRKDYLVCVETVVIHASFKAAADSGLFGLLVDAPVQLIDATDVKNIAQFRDLWATNPRRDMTPDGFFRDQKSFQARLARWWEELSSLWIFNAWYKAYKNGWRGVVAPEKIWLGPRYDEFGFERDMLIPGCLCSDDEPKALDYDLFSPNFHHPFVQQALAVMPRFQPRILFRLCLLDCHLQDRKWD
ncbi:hypothetical protein BDV59DRAFT_196410 [Aspergillus ambiguus]|uniref:uncharacterized protein n=1 Tax=Aspergillus ambiguus TaxID=176160 RepID=UPI003CCCE388